MSISVSEGFQFTDTSERIIDTASGSEFLATNHSWRDVNKTFDRLPELCVRAMLRSPDYEEPLSVLDIGAGVNRRASEELQDHRTFGRHVAVTGIDATMRSASYSASQVLGNFFDMPLPDASYDVIYSRQAIAVASMSKPNLLRRALHEVVRVMTPDGVAFVDVDPSDAEHEAGFKSSERLADTSLFLGRSGTFGRLRDTLAGYGYFHDTQHRSRFLIIAKGLGAPLLESLAAKGSDIEATQGIAI